MFLKLYPIFATLFIFGTNFAMGDSQRCNVGDSECERVMYNAVLEEYAGGINDLGIDPVDPIQLKDIQISFLGFVNLTLIDGVAKGVGKCKFVELKTFIAEIEKVKIHKECNISVEGRFRISSSNHYIEELLGVENINGEGNGTLKLDGFSMYLEFPYAFVKHDDGEIYLKSFAADIKYTKYELKDAKFIANELFFNNQEGNNFMITFLNENSSFMMTPITREIVSEVMKFYRQFCEKFFSKYPAKLYFKNDLGTLVKN